MKWTTVLLLASLQLLPGCDRRPTVNTHGTETEKASSIQAVKDSLPAERKDEFEEALKTLLFADVQGFADLADGAGIARRFQDRVDGLTGEEVIAEAERVRQLRADQERQRQLSEINELVQKLEAGPDDEVSRFVVERSRFETSERSGLGRSSAIELSVRNGTGFAVSRAYFRALLVTPGREIPWAEDEFNYKIPGGLEPGERASWRLSPGAFGLRSSGSDDRLDRILVVRAVQLDGADGEPIGTKRLSDTEEARLLELLKGMDGDRSEEARALLDARRAAVESWTSNAIRATAIQERAELRLAREQLGQIRVFGTRTGEPRFGALTGPIVEVMIENRSPSVIAWVRGEVRITSADRQAPWDEGRFLGLARPGVEPGATEWVSLSKASTLGTGRWLFPPEGVEAEVHIRIEMAEAPDSAPPFELEFTIQDERRLAALDALIASQGWNE